MTDRTRSMVLMSISSTLLTNDHEVDRTTLHFIMAYFESRLKICRKIKVSVDLSLDVIHAAVVVVCLSSRREALLKLPYQRAPSKLSVANLVIAHH